MFFLFNQKSCLFLITLSVTLTDDCRAKKSTLAQSATQSVKSKSRENTNKAKRQKLTLTEASQEKLDALSAQYKNEIDFLNTQPKEKKIKKFLKGQAIAKKKSKGFWHQFFLGEIYCSIPCHDYERRLLKDINRLKKNVKNLKKQSDSKNLELVQSSQKLVDQLELLNKHISSLPEYLEEARYLQLQRATIYQRTPIYR